eukprot:745935-Hanusia_phi.AAC.1
MCQQRVHAVRAWTHEDLGKGCSYPGQEVSPQGRRSIRGLEDGMRRFRRSARGGGGGGLESDPVSGQQEVTGFREPERERASLTRARLIPPD